MEACLAVEREQEKVVKKLKAVSGSATEKLQQVLHQIQALKELLTAAGERDRLPSLSVHVFVQLRTRR
ncbi:hypothetical protein GBAR_LOCUS26405 [Geodia barretti]|uniref:Uncharacterized protein n=1 Tax=Geodia barretti TaxID=519541 RepID=A0AA35X702_GEOBA|nr:hypothetical protein GBAR_LOCUS26405 [Geodia barretti]